MQYKYSNISKGYIRISQLSYSGSNTKIISRYTKVGDTVNQSKLIQVLSETIKDGRVISLIHKFLKAEVVVGGMFEDSSEANRTLDRILPYIERKLFLRVNREKTQVAYINRVKYLGYSFHIHKGEGRLRIHPKSVRKFKDRVREITGRSNGMDIESRKNCPNQLIRGWMNCFKLADVKGLIRRLMNGLDAHSDGYLEKVEKASHAL